MPDIVVVVIAGRSQDDAMEYEGNRWSTMDGVTMLSRGSWIMVSLWYSSFLPSAGRYVGIRQFANTTALEKAIASICIEVDWARPDR